MTNSNTCPYCGAAYVNLSGHLSKKRSPRTGSISFCAYQKMTGGTQTFAGLAVAPVVAADPLAAATAATAHLPESHPLRRLLAKARK